jgi:hypothetical protein
VTTRTQRRIAYTLAWLLLGAVQAISEAWLKRETEPVPAEHVVSRGITRDCGSIRTVDHVADVGRTTALGPSCRYVR